MNNTTTNPEAAPVVVTAWDRDETDTCEAGTPGCSVDHGASDPRAECDTW